MRVSAATSALRAPPNTTGLGSVALPTTCGPSTVPEHLPLPPGWALWHFPLPVGRAPYQSSSHYHRVGLCGTSHYLWAEHRTRAPPTTTGLGSVALPTTCGPSTVPELLPLPPGWALWHFPLPVG